MNTVGVAVKVLRHPEIASTGHVNCVTLMVCSDDCVIVSIDLHTKRKEMSPQPGATDEDYDCSIWLGGDEIMIQLPSSFKGGTISFGDTSRYTGHVCIMRSGLYHDDYDNLPLLWEDGAF